MLAETEGKICEELVQLLRRHDRSRPQLRKFFAIGHDLQRAGEFPQYSLNLRQLSPEFIGPVPRVQDALFVGAVPFRGKRPQVLVQHLRYGRGKRLAARVLLHGFARLPEDFPETFQRSCLYSVLIGQRLGCDAGVQLGEKLVGCGLVRVRDLRRIRIHGGSLRFAFAVIDIR